MDIYGGGNREAFNVGGTRTIIFCVALKGCLYQLPEFCTTHWANISLIYLNLLTLLAFRKLGLDCANWTKPIYNDLIRYELYSACNSYYTLCYFLDRVVDQVTEENSCRFESCILVFYCDSNYSDCSISVIPSLFRTN